MRGGLWHDDFAGGRNALEARRGVHDVTDRGEVADLALADDPDAGPFHAFHFDARRPSHAPAIARNRFQCNINRR
ncbi:hypothetical protein A5686_03430 [Mycobacterium sp. E2479]|nr:hypothetical protein A5686_03430 [Mycobacterium sp. E2479]